MILLYIYRYIKVLLTMHETNIASSKLSLKFVNSLIQGDPKKTEPIKILLIPTKIQ